MVNISLTSFEITNGVLEEQRQLHHIIQLPYAVTPNMPLIHDCNHALGSFELNQELKIWLRSSIHTGSVITYHNLY